MRDNEFEWDDRKAASNWRAHGYTFELARAAFHDPSSCEEPDPDPDEDRYSRTCRIVDVDVEHVLVVTYTERQGRVRVISARKATAYERQIYFDPRRP